MERSNLHLLSDILSTMKKRHRCLHSSCLWIWNKQNCSLIWSYFGLAFTRGVPWVHFWPYNMRHFRPRPNTRLERLPEYFTPGGQSVDHCFTSSYPIFLYLLHIILNLVSSFYLNIKELLPLQVNAKMLACHPLQKSRWQPYCCWRVIANTQK